MQGLTRCVSIFIIRNLVIGLDAFSWASLENLSKSVAIIPVTTFDGLTAPLAGLVVVTYFTDDTGHFLAMITLERKQLEDIPKIPRKLNFNLLDLRLVINQ